MSHIPENENRQWLLPVSEYKPRPNLRTPVLRSSPYRQTAVMPVMVRGAILWQPLRWESYRRRILFLRSRGQDKQRYLQEGVDERGRPVVPIRIWGDRKNIELRNLRNARPSVVAHSAGSINNPFSNCGRIWTQRSFSSRQTLSFAEFLEERI